MGWLVLQEGSTVTIMLNPSYISPDGIRRIAGHEGTVYHLYRDVAGIQTVCTGHVTLPGEDWSSVTPEKCQETLGRDLGKFVRCVLAGVVAPFSQPMLDAMVSLAFNIGCGGFATSTVLRLLNQLDYMGSAAAFKLWCNAQVKQIDGSFIKKPVLLGRRMAESELFLAGLPEIREGKLVRLPTVEESVRYSVGTLFNLQDTLHDGPIALSEEERRRGDFLTDDGKLVLMPPEREDLELAA